MKQVFIIQSSAVGIVGAAHTLPKAQAMARHYAEYACWNCSTQVVYNERSICLASGERISIDKTCIYGSAGKFAKVWPIPQQ